MSAEQNKAIVLPYYQELDAASPISDKVAMPTLPLTLKNPDNLDFRQQRSE